MLIITCKAILNVHKKHNFIVSVHTSARWVKSAQSAEPTFLIPTLLIGGCAGDSGTAGRLCINLFEAPNGKNRSISFMLCERRRW